eukprot:1705797-Prymnesium_polylepis.1
MMYCRLLLPGAAFDAISHDERLGVRQLRLLSAAVEGKRLRVQVVLEHVGDDAVVTAAILVVRQLDEVADIAQRPMPPEVFGWLAK